MRVIQSNVCERKLVTQMLDARLSTFMLGRQLRVDRGAVIERVALVH